MKDEREILRNKLKAMNEERWRLIRQDQEKGWRKYEEDAKSWRRISEESDKKYWEQKRLSDEVKREFDFLEYKGYEAIGNNDDTLFDRVVVSLAKLYNDNYKELKKFIGEEKISKSYRELYQSFIKKVVKTGNKNMILSLIDKYPASFSSKYPSNITSSIKKIYYMNYYTSYLVNLNGKSIMI